MTEEKLMFVLDNNFVHFSYTEAIEILKTAIRNKRKVQYLIDDWGADLQSEHERYLVEKHFKRPVILLIILQNKGILHAFKWRQQHREGYGHPLPGIGEIVGGSQREERFTRYLKPKWNHGHSGRGTLLVFGFKKIWNDIHSGFGLGLNGWYSLWQVWET